MLGAVAWFTAFSVMYTLAKAITYFFPGVPIRGCGVFAVIVATGLGYAAYKIWQPTKIVLRIPNTNTKLTVNSAISHRRWLSYHSGQRVFRERIRVARC